MVTKKKVTKKVAKRPARKVVEKMIDPGDGPSGEYERKVRHEQVWIARGRYLCAESRPGESIFTVKKIDNGSQIVSVSCHRLAQKIVSVLEAGGYDGYSVGLGDVMDRIRIAPRGAK